MNSYLHYVVERKCTKFCLKQFTILLGNHTFGCEILGVNCTPGVLIGGGGGGGAWVNLHGEKEKFSKKSWSHTPLFD